MFGLGLWVKTRNGRSLQDSLKGRESLRGRGDTPGQDEVIPKKGDTSVS